MPRVTKIKSAHVRFEISDHSYLTARASATGVSFSEYVRRMTAQDRERYAVELRGGK